MTEQLLDREAFNGVVLEPAAGNGAIVKVLRDRGLNCVWYADRDFLAESDQYDSVVTNPPFSLAFEFVVKAKTVARQSFALLLPLAYLHGKQRLDHIYSDRVFPLSVIYVFVRYPMLGDPIRPDGRYRTGMMVYAWFVWKRHTDAEEPIIRWLDNSAYVLRGPPAPQERP